MHKANIKFTMQYDGTKYYGWQRLGSEYIGKSIQGILEERISNFLGEDIKIIGSGRTDAGVHAFGQVANFYTKSDVSLQDMKLQLNTIIPNDMQIIQLENVPRTFHSRYDARSKIYEYHIDTALKQNVFTRKYTAHVPGTLDLVRMKQVSNIILGKHDFKGFASEMKDGRDTVRELYDINFYEEGSILIIKIHGSGFLYNMVRIIVGTLVEVGLGKKSLLDVSRIISTKNRQLAGPTMGSQGLFLRTVLY